MAIVGESGSGKSVTAHTVLSLLPDNAEVNYDAITFQQRTLSSLTPAELRSYRGGDIGIIFQEPSLSFDPLYPIGKTFHETIRAHFSEIRKEEVQERTIGLLREIGIDDAEKRIHNYPHQFSGGQLQRISLALAIAADPEILIADEPTTALDVTIQADIIALLKRIIKKRSLSVIFISHDITLISSVADRIAVMYSGHLLEIGDVRQITSDPHHPYSAALLGSVINPGVHYTRDALHAIRGAPPSPFATHDGCPFAERCDYVHEACRRALPPMQVEKSMHRCLIPGGKKI